MVLKSAQMLIQNMHIAILKGFGPFQAFQMYQISSPKIWFKSPKEGHGISRFGNLRKGPYFVKKTSVGHVLPVTTLSEAIGSLSCRCVSTVKLINCSVGYHHGLSGLICRALSQSGYKETSSFRSVIYCKNHILIQVLLSIWWNVQTKYLLA